jgi:hypothetical protein
MANFPNNTHPLLTAKGIHGRVLVSIEERPQNGLVDSITTSIPADNVTETIASLGTVAPMQEWIGERDEKGFGEHSVNVTSKDWELTVPVPRRLLRLDKTGLASIGSITDQVAQRMATHPTKLIYDILNGTVSAIGYDGEALFSNSHTVGDQALDNKISADISTYPVTVAGTTALPSPAELVFSVMKGIEAMMAFTDDQGEPTNEDVTEFVAVMPLGYMTSAKIAFGSQQINQQDGINPLQTEGVMVTPVNSTRVSASDKIYLFAANQPVGAFLKVDLEEPDIRVLGPESEHFAKKNEALIMASRAYNLGIGRFDKAVEITLV